MTDAEIDGVRIRLLKASRGIPTRQHSPYGGVGPDHEAILALFRDGYEALLALQDRLNKATP